MSNPSSPRGLVANISQVTLFQQDVTLTAPEGGPPPPIAGYTGEPLFVTGIAVDANNVLVITIDDQGPPASPPAALATVPIAAQAKVSYKSGGTVFYPSTLTGAPPAYTGGPLILAATLVPDPMTFETDLKPSVAPWKPPQDDLCYVIINEPGGATRLFWLADDIVMPNVPTAARVVPKVDAPGSLGPFGLETG